MALSLWCENTNRVKKNIENIKVFAKFVIYIHKHKTIKSYDKERIGDNPQEEHSLNR